MAFVPAKCTQCGGDIDVDDTKEAGICKHCGTAFITEKAINNYNTYITNNNVFTGANVAITGVDITGLLESAKKELLIHNYTNANFYLDEVKKSGSNSIQKISNLFKEVKLLDVARTAWNIDPESKETKEIINELMTYDSQNIEVWLFALETSFWAQDIISYGNKVIALSSHDKKEYYSNKVYSIYIEKEFSPNKIVSKVNLIDEIPTDAFHKNVALNRLLFDKCKAFITNSDTAIIFAWREEIEKYCAKLQENERNEIENQLKSNKSGCYIATCVYGSYDCPQVWTLRRYRDFSLDVTWYGRVFVKCYYAISPILVKRFGNQKWFKTFWKRHLDNLVDKLNKKGIKNTHYQDKY